MRSVPKQVLITLACISIWGVSTTWHPLPWMRGNPATFVFSLALLAAFSWGVALFVLAAGALFLAGRRKANPALPSPKQFLSGLGEEARHRWESRGCRRPALRGFLHRLGSHGSRVFYALVLQAAFGSLFGLAVVILLRALR